MKKIIEYLLLSIVLTMFIYIAVFTGVYLGISLFDAF